MKQLLILTMAVVFAFTSCKTKPAATENTEPGKFTISGNITGFTNALSIYGEDVSAQIKPDSAGNFSYEGEIKKADFFSLMYGKEKRQQIYLKPGSEIKLEVDYAKLTANSRSAVRISGKGAKESELLNQLKVNSSTFKYSKDEYFEVFAPKIYSKNPADFAAYYEDQLQSEYTFIDEFVKMNKEVDADFVKHLKLNMMIDGNREFQLYEIRRASFKLEKVEVPAKFTDYYADRIPQKDFELCKENNTYKNYVRGQYYKQVEIALKDYPRESLEWYKARVEYLENCDFPAHIVQDIFNGFTIGYMRTKDLETRAFITDVIKNKVTDESSLARWEEYKAREEGYTDGDMAPDFTHNDINGKMVSLSDFRGKLVYIDLWATWCGPCMKGVPFYDKVRKKYAKDKVAFVAISLDENIDAWKKTVTENEGGIFDGIQINTGSYKCDISENFVLNGIPQYVLIGADGRIIKKNAPRPHGDEIYALIDAELAKLK